MKKIITFILVVVMSLSLCACDSNGGSSKADSPEIGTVYTYQHDKWDLYKASLMSDNLIKIECWNSAIAYDEEYPLEYDHNVLVIKTDDGSTDFSWVNEERTAFTVTMKDEQNSRFEEPALVYFELVDNSND